ncbi:hypothetical protein [Archangium lipolyticum]|uniref:hypothetical protein n=1 Tax=Archangium lipolyticum TaxID=2970465 RepID=UPI002149C42E|nr:hypothetical protein [Archangium lipolyticum]
MSHRPMLKFRGLLASSMLLGACVSTPGRGVPGHYALDSLSNGCLRNPAYCATLTGKETTTVQAVGTAVASGAAVLAVLDKTLEEHIQEELVDCANLARSEVLIRHRAQFVDPTPSDAECRQWTTDAQGRRVTWAMRLGSEMHEVALQCAQGKLNGLRPGGFSLEPCYRHDLRTGQTTFISCEQVEELLANGCSSELKGTIRPDVVIHTGNPLQALAVFDFKFPCVNKDGDKSSEWREYPEGHPCHGLMNQGQLYKKALGPEPVRVAPRWGILR